MPVSISSERANKSTNTINTYNNYKVKNTYIYQMLIALKVRLFGRHGEKKW
jgi:hypothetical protein